jgi:hypothetical protein
MRLIWLGLAVLLVVAAVGGSTRLENNPNARIGLYFLAAAGVLLFVALLF